MTPVRSATRNLVSESAPAEGRGATTLHSCANAAPPIHDRSKPSRKLPGVVVLAVLNLASP